jgi:hypothetical protein
VATPPVGWLVPAMPAIVATRPTRSQVQGLHDRPEALTPQIKRAISTASLYNRALSRPK